LPVAGGGHVGSDEAKEVFAPDVIVPNAGSIGLSFGEFAAQYPI
jgi:hypothetical protein